MRNKPNQATFAIHVEQSDPHKQGNNGTEN